MSTSPGSAEPTERAPLLARAEDQSATDEPSRPHLSRPRAFSVIFFFTVLIFLQSSNFSVMSTASTAVAADLEAYTDTSWFTSAYLIAMSSLSPLSGRLAQIFDPRSCAFVSGVVFATGALLAAQAQDFTAFIAGRAVQGAGAAGIYTLSVNLVLYLADKNRRGLLIGGANSAITAGVSMGAVIGGEFVTSIGWAPLALASATCLLFCIPSIQELQPDRAQSTRQKLGSIDYLGSVLLVTTLTSFLFGLASSTVLLLPILLSLVFLFLFVIQELYGARSPVIPVSVLSSRGVLLSTLAQLFFMTTRWCVLFYSPVYTLAVRIWEPATAGTVLIPTNLGFALGGLIVGWLHIRHGGSYYMVTLLCLGVFPVTVVVLARLATPYSPVGLYIAMVFVNGALAGAGLNYGLAHLLYITDPTHHFVSTALIATARGFAGSFGSGIGGGLFLRALRQSLRQGFREKDLTGPRIDELVEKLLGSPALVSSLQGDQREVAISGYATAIQVLFLAFSGLAAIAVLVQAGTGWSGWPEREQAEGWWAKMRKWGRKWWTKHEEER